MAAAGACPQCGQPTRRVHAFHQRRLADLPIWWPGHGRGAARREFGEVRRR
ncbi:transposase family protein [Micromonospora sp. NPDC005206]|uniref:transposase family protein n=1 Tax=Micromonospora sp. NPDC005206 TaxID=3157022 RepID=UPI00339E00D9